MGPITEELARFLEGPNSIAVATQDGALAPECARALAMRCGPVGAGDRVTLWLPLAQAARTRANLARSDRIAVAVNRPTTHQTFQLKGRALRVADAAEAQRPLVEAYFEAVTREAVEVGLPRRLLDRVVRWPILEIEVQVDEVFDQTPGPGAGQRCAPTAGPPPR